jgi:hypothetical protein
MIYPNVESMFPKSSIFSSVANPGISDIRDLTARTKLFAILADFLITSTAIVEAEEVEEAEEETADMICRVMKGMRREGIEIIPNTEEPHPPIQGLVLQWLPTPLQRPPARD